MIEYIEDQAKARGLDEWREDPERFIADLNTRIKMLEAAVIQVQLKILTDAMAAGAM